MNSRGVRITSLLLVLGVGLFLRTYHLTDDLIAADEAFSWRVSTCTVPEMIHRVAGDTHPLLHFFVLKLAISVFGSSTLVIRLPSVVAGEATILVVYWLTRDSITAVREPGDAERASPHWVPLLAAAYIALHPLHIDLSRTARMYALAGLLSGLSAWALVGALDTRRSSRWSWILYGIAAGLLLHAHNFGVFLVFAQFVFAIGLAILDPRRRSALVPSLCGFGLAGLIYLPWLVEFIAQATRVKEGFWIPPLTLRSLGESVAVFGYGSSDAPLADPWIALLVIVVMLWTVVFRGDWATRGVALQVTIPWLLTIAISIFAERPILQDRYLVSASVPFAAWLAMTVWQFKNQLVRCLLIVNALVPLAVCAATAWQQMPASAPPIEAAMNQLKNQSKPGDVLLVRAPAHINILRFYSAQRGAIDIAMKCVTDPPGTIRKGQINHISSLDADELLPIANVQAIDAQRIWTLNEPFEVREDEWKTLFVATYPEMPRAFPAGLQLTLYERVAARTAPGAKPR
jgi:mannosyltransferase